MGEMPLCSKCQFNKLPLPKIYFECVQYREDRLLDKHNFKLRSCKDCLCYVGPGECNIDDGCAFILGPQIPPELCLQFKPRPEVEKP